MSTVPPPDLRLAQPSRPGASEAWDFLSGVPARFNTNLETHVTGLELSGFLQEPYADTFRHSLQSEHAHRTRPIIVYATALALGVPRSEMGRVDRYALGMEEVHTMSLIHDDSRAQDDSSKRRYKPTLHLAFDD